ncbi:MAG TPA: hypothetical protein VJZ00_21045 [Thermoanaerobaculia bacterium]|nr:hypothetical protein [Thermoanaerobaculia bacterium]
MKKHFATLAAAFIAVVGASPLFADCASTPWSSDNTNGVYTTICPKVGIGTTTPGAKLHVLDNTNANSFIIMENSNVGTSAAGVLRAKSDVAQVNFQSHSSARTISRFGVTLGGWNEFLGTTGNGLAIGTNTGAGPLVLGTASTARITILTDGKVGIGTATPTVALDVVGSIKATSIVGAVYQDLAEWVPASTDMAPGTVVVLNADRSNEVMPSSKAYDTAVAGVVSAQPGIILGEGSASKEMIATTGRVKVHVTTANGAIKVGDLLATSDKPGVAMRSEAIEIGGARLHRPGTLIGKALESLSTGDGDILVLLSMQ